MSSVIVLDSSDEEEVPAKKAFIAPSIPATITPIKGSTTQCKTNVSANQLKHKKTKPRPIPSGITITRRSPINVTATNPNNNNATLAAANLNAKPKINESFAATISAATLAATSKLNSIMSKPATTTSISKMNTTSGLSNIKERQTPTPPKQMTQQQSQKSQQQQQQTNTMQPAKKQQQQQQQHQVLPHLSQLPQLQPSPLVLSKRLTATTTTTPVQQLQKVMQQQQQPPKLQKLKQLQQQQQNLPKLQQHQQQKQKKSLLNAQNEPNARKLNRSPATLTPINVGNNSIKAPTSNAPMLPMISSVQSMAASAAPPLQLLATPPHSASTTFSDQQLFSPKSMHTTSSLPPSTTVTASRPQLSSSNINTNNSNSNNNISSSSKNINNSFKILLPPKSSNSTFGVNLTTSSAAGTPITPTPVALQQTGSGPRIAYVNSLAPQISPTLNKTTNSNNVQTKAQAMPPTTIVPIAITASAQLLAAGADVATSGAITGSTSVSGSGLASVRRVKPTTLLRKNDDAWLKRTSATSATSTTITATKNYNDDDLVLELLPHSSSAETPTQKSTAKVVKNIARPSMLDADTSITIIPNIPNSMKSNTQKSVLRKPKYPLKIDLTESPEKAYTALRPNTPTTSPSTAVVKSKSIDLITNGDATTTTEKSNNNNNSKSAESERPSLSSDYEELLRVCREAEKSTDMEKLVKSKLPKYYYNAHPDFVRSKGFSKSLRTVITNIQKEPDLVYLHLKTIVDELKVRTKSKEVLPAAAAVVKIEENTNSVDRDSCDNGVAGGISGGGDSTNDDPSSTGNKRTDEQIKKLNKALYILTKRIEVLESAEVDWEDEDSSYLQVERFKKRACQIYEKICDLTGESKNAHRLVKKPIHFNGTTYTQFNRTLQAYVNRTKEFPDYFDVLRMLEHCNRQYEYALANFEMKRIAHDAFIKIGKLLQSRRKTDLYETVTHFTAHEKDPATSDPMLQAKLSENQKKRTRITDVIEKYAREQDVIREELKEARQAKLSKRLRSESSDDAEEDDNVASTSASAAKAAAIRIKKKHKKENGETAGNENNGDFDSHVMADDDDDDDEDEDDEDKEDDDEEQVNGSDLEAEVEKLANGYLSDVESDVEIVINSPAEEINTEDQIENDTKSIKDPLSVGGDTTDIATTNKIKSDATLKTQKVSTRTNRLVTTPTQQTKPSINNNKETRRKTADSLDILLPKFTATNASKSAPTKTTTTTTETDDSKHAEATAIANGCMKSVTQSGSSDQPAIKIVSLASLKDKVNIIDGKEEDIIDGKQQQKQGSRSDDVSSATKTQKQAITTTTTKESKRQRTVAEIVISDEET